MNCMWCDSTEAKESLNTVYWELPRWYESH